MEVWIDEMRLVEGCSEKGGGVFAHSPTHSNSITLSLGHCFLSSPSAASLSRWGLTLRVRGLYGLTRGLRSCSAAAAADGCGGGRGRLPGRGRRMGHAALGPIEGC